MEGRYGAVSIVGGPCHFRVYNRGMALTADSLYREWVKHLKKAGFVRDKGWQRGFIHLFMYQSLSGTVSRVAITYKDVHSVYSSEDAAIILNALRDPKWAPSLLAVKGDIPLRIMGDILGTDS